MLGAIIGDIVGSRFEFDNIKSKEFTFLDDSCFFTDDTVMTVAIAKAIISCKNGAASLGSKVKANMLEFGRKYPDRGYGSHFEQWLYSDNHQPYNSYGNGSAMRISPVGFFATSEPEIKSYSYAATAVTHNHNEGLKGAEAIAMSIYWARCGMSKAEIFDRLALDYYPEIKTDKLSYKNLIKNYSWNYGQGSVTCQSSVPQALVCFNESINFEDAIRMAVSIGGDSDTIAAMVGGIAEAYYGIPNDIKKKALTFLPSTFIDIINEFYELVRCVSEDNKTNTADKERELNALAQVLQILVKEYVENPTFAIRDSLRYVHRQVVTDILASKDAFEDYFRRTGEDIRKIDWYGKAIKENGASININRLYTLDHLTTAKDFKDDLVKAYRDGNLSLEYIKERLKKQRLCWITKAEDRELKRRGYNSHRPDPYKAYAEAGIIILRTQDNTIKRQDKYTFQQNNDCTKIKDNTQMTNAEQQQLIFWNLYNELLEKQGKPFSIATRTHYASVNRHKPTNVKAVVIEFLLQKQQLRLGVYLYDDVALYNKFENNKANIESQLGFSPIWEHGTKGKNTRRIYSLINFKPYDIENYREIIETSIPIVKKYIEVFDNALKSSY